ncbi:class I SAM-dependent methyltransferase [Achromobacter aegrifaciens]|uniref:class I SAM-dependent methyltransferase n=1 Tax=Achromobacter aegrifaciens TaxID=1287736 RepID=UPI001467F6F1|nr:class I SAM-dependent methyltransferase [Achromobacter aegrifaciens]CAB3664872.1 Trans-aconitate 2-methyltransferase [Achromobacter aegrifaciens]
MIICPACGTRKTDAEGGCVECGFKPARINGFLAWAPELAHRNDGFREHSFAALAKVEENNFWFRARNRIVLWALRKYHPRFESVLEVGCGTGFVLSGITREFPDARSVGSEIHVSGLAYAAERLPRTELIQVDARKLPYDAEFDVVAAFDVIEHIAEDELVLQNLHRAVRPGGCCLITVPQHQWLWSSVDEAACHQRRYSAQELHSKMKAAGFDIVHSTSFVMLLLPLMLLSRLAARRSGKDQASEALEMGPLQNKLLEIVMRIELVLVKASLRLPIGGSRLVVLRRR